MIKASPAASVTHHHPDLCGTERDGARRKAHINPVPRSCSHSLKPLLESVSSLCIGKNLPDSQFFCDCLKPRTYKRTALITCNYARNCEYLPLGLEHFFFRDFAPCQSLFATGDSHHPTAVAVNTNHHGIKKFAIILGVRHVKNIRGDTRHDARWDGEMNQWCFQILGAVACLTCMTLHGHFSR